MTKAIVVAEDRCLACGTCKLECAMAHTHARTLAEALQGGTAPQSRVYVEPIGQWGMPLQCRHCQDAPCIGVCPTGAIPRFSDEGPVLLDQDRCIVCRQCLLVCPFGVIELSRNGKTIIKCDQCLERTESGQDPACVSACPTGALKFIEINAYIRQRRRASSHRAWPPSRAVPFPR